MNSVFFMVHYNVLHRHTSKFVKHLDVSKNERWADSNQPHQGSLVFDKYRIGPVPHSLPLQRPSLQLQPQPALLPQYGVPQQPVETLSVQSPG